MNEIALGRFGGLTFSARPSFVLSTFLLWIVLSTLGMMLFSLGDALLGAAIAVALHWATEIAHHLGHAFAARRTGYPMTGVRLGFLIGASLYPPDEPPLPAGVHVRRALGGPAASLLVAMGALALLLALRAVGGLAWWLALFLFLDNLLNVVQIFVPLGFNDGYTLFTWLRKR